jgi:hypothetical protein
MPHGFPGKSDVLEPVQGNSNSDDYQDIPEFWSKLINGLGSVHRFAPGDGLFEKS